MRRGVPESVAKMRNDAVVNFARSNENTTSSAVKGVPSWNLTPFRRWKIQRFGSGFSQEVASIGVNFICLSYWSSDS